MTERTFRDCRVLVVEDEYFLADEIARELTEAGATVLGPVGTLGDAVAIIDLGDTIDGAILDANLRGEMVFPAADMLIGLGVPFVFTTGYDASVFPDRFKDVAICDKPVDIDLVKNVIGRAILS